MPLIGAIYETNFGKKICEVLEEQRNCRYYNCTGEHWGVSEEADVQVESCTTEQHGRRKTTEEPLSTRRAERLYAIWGWLQRGMVWRGCGKLKGQAGPDDKGFYGFC